MKVQVLQGINLKNTITTVIIEDKKVKKDIIEFYKNLHLIFMEKYVIKGNSIEIATKIHIN